MEPTRQSDAAPDVKPTSARLACAALRVATAWEKCGELEALQAEAKRLLAERDEAIVALERCIGDVCSDAAFDVAASITNKYTCLRHEDGRIEVFRPEDFDSSGPEWEPVPDEAFDLPWAREHDVIVQGFKRKRLAL